MAGRLELSRAADRLRTVQTVADRALGAAANDEVSTGASLLDGIDRKREPVWPSQLLYALVKCGALVEVSPYRSAQQPAVYEIGDVTMLEAIRDDGEVAGHFVSGYDRADRTDVDYIPPRFREPTLVDDPEDLVESDDVEASGPDSEPVAAATSDVNEALLSALERVAGYLVSVKEELARDRAERDAQTDLVLALGERMEKVPSRDDLAEVAAELIASLVRSSPASEIAQLRAENVALRGELVSMHSLVTAGFDALNAAIKDLNMTVGARLDVQSAKQNDAISALKTHIDSAFDTKVPDFAEGMRIFSEATESGLTSVKRATELLPKLVEGVGNATQTVGSWANLVRVTAQEFSGVIIDSSSNPKKTSQRIAAALSEAEGAPVTVTVQSRQTGRVIGEHSAPGPSLGLIAALPKAEEKP